MAKKPAAQPVNALEEESKDRLSSARLWKSQWEMDFRECYFFASPHRERFLNSSAYQTMARLQDAALLNTDEAFILCGDFITEIVNGFLPPDKPWVERGPGMDISPEVWKQVENDVREGDIQIFNAIRASNFYTEVPKSFNPDLPIGTVALWIDRPHTSKAIVNSAVPLRELEINVGPYGDIDDRFAVRHTRNCYVRELVGEEIWAKIPAELMKDITEKHKERTQVVWGFWRIWHDHSDEVWQHVVMVGKTGDNLVHDVQIKGEGCVPLWVGRFNPTPDSPFGLGVLMQGLPTLRQIDEMELALQDHFDLSLRPPVTYPNDSFSSVEQGFESGMGYPIRPGEEVAIKNIYNVPPARDGVYTYEDKLKKLRKLFYVDFPEQTGDTPPTASQWMDELARTQRRIGTPGMPFWRDLSQIFLRYKYLLEQSGAIKPLQVNGSGVSTLPRNPSQAAAEQMEVNMAVKALQIAGSIFPEEAKANIDGRATMENIFEKMRVDDLIKLRAKADVANAVKQIAQLTSGQAPQNPDTQAGPAA